MATTTKNARYPAHAEFCPDGVNARRPCATSALPHPSSTLYGPSGFVATARPSVVVSGRLRSRVELPGLPGHRMGYDVRITREAAFSEEEQPLKPIHRGELLALLATMPHLSLDTDSWSIRRAEDGTEVREHPVAVRGQAPDPDCLWTGRGEITTKAPRAETLRWMVIVARRLDAYVLGDDGEEYDLDENGALVSDGQPYSSERSLLAPDAELMDWVRKLPSTRSASMGAAQSPPKKAGPPADDSRMGKAILLVILAAVVAWIIDLGV